MKKALTTSFLLTVALVPPTTATIIGTNPPALSLSAERIAALPAAQQPAWNECLEHSRKQSQTDRAFLASEMREHGIKQSTVPPSGRAVRSLPLDNSPSWYAEPAARRIADIVVSFQTPAGGWSKNLDLTTHPRAPGEGFAPDNRSRHLSEFDFDAPHDTNWNYVGTFDNDATVTELRFLAKIITAIGTNDVTRYRTAFLRGIDYILAAQYPNGGWPQVWPLEGGYHDTITYNDNAMINILTLLRDISEGTDNFASVPAAIRARTAASVKRGIACIVATQIVTGGRRTVWCQQHDPLTLQPTSGRNYEMPAEVSSESADILTFLMELPNPDTHVVAAVHAAAAWFVKTRISDMAFMITAEGGRRLVMSPGAGPLWARYYEIGTDRPIFGDRDKTIHDNVDEISRERRFGYAWYRDNPARALEEYARWSKIHPQPHER